MAWNNYSLKFFRICGLVELHWAVLWLHVPRAGGAHCQQLADGWGGRETQSFLAGSSCDSPPCWLGVSQHGAPVIPFLTAHLALTRRKQKMPCQASSGLDSGVRAPRFHQILSAKESHKTSPYLRRTDSTSWWVGVASTHRGEKDLVGNHFLRPSITDTSLYISFLSSFDYYV